MNSHSRNSKQDSFRRGFGLLSILLWTALLLSLILLLHLRLQMHARITPEVERQLYSHVLAQNGIEYARAVLPFLEISSLLKGPDQRWESNRKPGWRNPISFAEAQRMDNLLSVRLSPDDGLPAVQGKALLPTGYPARGEGAFFIRFSNNSEESPEVDSDKIVLVRSLGVARAFQRSSPQLSLNAVTLVEAAFRKETAFELKSAATLVGDEGRFVWRGDEFRIDGGRQWGISCIQPAGGGLPPSIESSLSPEQGRLIRGRNTSPSIADETQSFHEDRSARRTLQPLFWNHFLSQLPLFANESSRLHYFPEGGRIRDSVEGVVIARGDFIVEGQGRILGLLLHLGGGALILRDQASLEGALWMSHLATAGGKLEARPLHLEVSGRAAIEFNLEKVAQALTAFPATLMSWRIIFPEMPGSESKG